MKTALVPKHYSLNPVYMPSANRGRHYSKRYHRYRRKLVGLTRLSPNRMPTNLQFIRPVAEMVGAIKLNRMSAGQWLRTIRESGHQLKKEAILRRDEAQKLNQILNGNVIPTFVIDAAHRITHWNRACELLTGLPAAEMIGTDRHREAFYIERRPVMADFVVNQSGIDELEKFYGNKVRRSRLIKDGYEGQDHFPDFGPGGKWLFFTAAPIRDSEGRIIGAVETLQDITESWLNEKELRASATHYRQLFESANDAIFLLTDGAIVDCNPKALSLFECTRSELINHLPLELSPEIQPSGLFSKDEIERKRESILKDVPDFFEWRFLKPNGNYFDAEVSMRVFRISDVPYSLAVVRDISKRKALIRELDQKSRYLEKVNQALKDSLDHREVEKRAVEENILINLKRFVFPYVEKLQNHITNQDAKTYLNILDTNLRDVISHFSETVFSKYIDFTPAEVRIADLIRDGKDTKEIAQLLRLSPSSVQWHRKNIRVKLKLTSKKINLRTYLNSLKK